MTTYGYLIDVLTPPLPVQRKAILEAGCETVFLDMQGQFNKPFMQRSEAYLLCMKIKTGDTLIVHSHHLLGPDINDLLTFVTNRNFHVIDSRGVSLGYCADDSRQLAYEAEANRLNQLGVPYDKDKAPLGWKRDARNWKLVRNSKERAWCEMLLCLIEDHSITTRDIDRFKKLKIRDCIDAARRGFPIVPPTVTAIGEIGTEDRIIRRRDSYMQILGGLNDRPVTVKELSQILESRKRRPAFMQQRLVELKRMGAVLGKMDSEGEIRYYRDWTWEGDAQPFSLLAMFRALHERPHTAGQLSEKFLTPRWLISEILSQTEGVRVTFDRKHRAIYRFVGDPEKVNYHRLKQRFRFAVGASNAAYRTSRLRARAADEIRPATYGIARPRQDRPASQPAPSPPPDHPPVE